MIQRRTWGALVVLLVVATACHRKDSASGAGASASAEAPTLPPLVFKDDTPGALLTWIDDQGDFHVAEHTTDVPTVAQKAVRVAVPGRKDGTEDSVYVADLTAKNADGSYVVKSMPRASWDELGASKRKTRLEGLAPSAAPPVASGAPSPASSASAAHGEITAIIYGASWCGPCHQAEALLKSLGVKVTKKDIEQSDEAQAEMQEKLNRAHRRGGSIPVIDVMGQLFVGFSEGALRAAVEQARGALH